MQEIMMLNCLLPWNQLFELQCFALGMRAGMPLEHVSYSSDWKNPCPYPSERLRSPTVPSSRLVYGHSLNCHERKEPPVQPCEQTKVGWREVLIEARMVVRRWDQSYDQQCGEVVTQHQNMVTRLLRGVAELLGLLTPCEGFVEEETGLSVLTESPW